MTITHKLVRFNVGIAALHFSRRILFVGTLKIEQLRLNILEVVLHFGTAHDFPITQYLLNICSILQVIPRWPRVTHSHFWSAICNLSYTILHFSTCTSIVDAGTTRNIFVTAYTPTTRVSRPVCKTVITTHPPPTTHHHHHIQHFEHPTFLLNLNDISSRLPRPCSVRNKNKQTKKSKIVVLK